MNKLFKTTSEAFPGLSCLVPFVLAASGCMGTADETGDYRGALPESDPSLLAGLDGSAGPPLEVEETLWGSVGDLDVWTSTGDPLFGEVDDEGGIDKISRIPVDVIDASYGLNCGANRNNALWNVVDECDGTSNCRYYVNVGVLGDPARKCAKDFHVRWGCGTNNAESGYIRPEAHGDTITLACQNPTSSTANKIDIKAATYGENCNASPNNALTDVTRVCEGFGSCRYLVSTSILGDPARRCSKDFRVRYTCSNDSTYNRYATVPREANGKYFSIDCN